jgi:hypothetical protein
MCDPSPPPPGVVFVAAAVVIIIIDGAVVADMRSRFSLATGRGGGRRVLLAADATIPPSRRPLDPPASSTVAGPRRHLPRRSRRGSSATIDVDGWREPEERTPPSEARRGGILRANVRSRLLGLGRR